jgi:CPA2 family monovalent cation:H+ antiporter-2
MNGLPVLRGDSSRQHTLQLAGIERAKAIVVADDDPGTAMRIVAVARGLAPTARIVVRTRYQSDADRLSHEGSDRVVVEELESVVQLFADVLRSYRISAEEIQTHEDAIRHGGYAALREESADPVVVCELDGHCLDTRTVTVRDRTGVIGVSPESLASSTGLQIVDVERDGGSLSRNEAVQFAPGDVITLAGPTEGFISAASFFRIGDGAPVADTSAATPASRAIDLDTVVAFSPRSGSPCTHLATIKPVRPSARGCEECLRIGDRWVHLRICLTCGHVGCCDTSKNKHATAHFHTTSHPIMRSLEPGEDWGWCYADKVTL